MPHTVFQAKSYGRGERAQLFEAFPLVNDDLGGEPGLEITSYLVDSICQKRLAGKTQRAVLSSE